MTAAKKSGAELGLAQEHKQINEAIDQVTGLGTSPKTATPQPAPGPPLPVQGPTTAYRWTRSAPQAMPALTPAKIPDRSGLSGWLDGNVKAALDECGIMNGLEEVTGNLNELNAAAEEWHAQAVAVSNVAEQLRAECSSLPEQWQGPASDAFGQHMGQVVQALDATAAELYQTAQIINQAAQMCAMAESMVIEIIGEAIEALIASLAMEAVVTVLTLGIGAIASAMIDAAEVMVFVERVGKVSEELGKLLEDLVKALKEMKEAFKSLKSLKDVKKALGAAKKARDAFRDLRKFKDGGDSLLKIAMDAKEAKSLEGVGTKLADYGVRQATHYADSKATNWADGEFKQDVLGDSSDDPVSTFSSRDLKTGGTTVGKKLLNGLSNVGTAGKAMGKSAWSAAEPGLTGGTMTNALEGEVGQFLQQNETGREFANSEVGGAVLDGTGVGQNLKESETTATPYRVDKSRIENAFG